MTHKLLLIATLSLAMLTTTGCGAGSGDGSSGSTSGSSSSSSGPDYSSSFAINESNEDHFTLTDTSPSHLDVNNTITLSQPTTVMAFTSAEYSVEIYAMDGTNAQLFLNGQAFQGYLLNSSSGGTGFYPVNLPAGTFYIGAVPGQSSIPAGYSNPGFDEVSVVTLSNWYFTGNTPDAASGSAMSYKSESFTIGSSPEREFIETEGTGTWMVMTNDQYQSFLSTYSTSTGGLYNYLYACGGQSGGAASEIECELSLTPGTYWILWLNDTGGWAGGAGNIQFFSPD